MPWMALIAAGIQGVSAVDKSEKRKDAERELENMQVPSYRRNQSIIDFYDEALRKYKVAPTESAAYKLDKQNAMQGTTQGLRALQDRRSGLAGIPALISGQNNALLKAAVRAEQDKSRQAGIVSSASSAAQAETDREYQYNQIWPFQKKYNLLALKAANLARSQDASTQGAFNSLGSAAGGMGGGSGGGGGMGGLGGLMGSFSDNRLKHNYTVIGKSPSGINIYEFSYLGSNKRYQGVMAQEVPQASFVAGNGFLMVDYSMIDVQFKEVK